ncbi:MAG: hypothetical protein R3B13_15865 [Polyangiaceae bacterium]
MSDEKPDTGAESAGPSERPRPDARGASQDLADGLELMLRAARKVVKKVDPTKIESAGRRAMESLESLDTKRVSEIGKKAAKNLDPKKIEEVAGDAGRELLNVIERVADRMEKIVDRAMHDEADDRASADDTSAANARAGSTPPAASEPPAAASEPPAAASEPPEAPGASSSEPPRVRVSDD